MPNGKDKRDHFKNHLIRLTKDLNLPEPTEEENGKGMKQQRR